MIKMAIDKAEPKRGTFSQSNFILIKIKSVKRFQSGKNGRV